MTNVIPFRGRSLVAVRVESDRFSVMLAKIGEPAARRQVAYPTLEQAEREAREGAALCGWRYVGVIDEARLRRMTEYGSPRTDEPGPSAA